MDELIEVTQRDGEALVNARNLHESLRVGRDFSNWIKNRIEKYGFVENEDFFKYEDLNVPNLVGSKGEGFSPNLAKTPVKDEKQQNLGGRPSIDYLLTLDMAKELAMVENNEVGRNVRRYLIQVEKKAKELAFAVGGQVSAEFNARLDRMENALEGLAEFKSAVLKIAGAPKVVEYRTINSQLDESIYSFYEKHIDDTVPAVFYTKAVNVWELFKYDSNNKYSRAEFLERFKAMYPQFAFEKHKNVDVFWGLRLVDTCGVC